MLHHQERDRTSWEATSEASCARRRNATYRALTNGLKEKLSASSVDVAPEQAQAQGLAAIVLAVGDVVAAADQQKGAACTSAAVECPREGGPEHAPGRIRNPHPLEDVGCKAEGFDGNRGFWGFGGVCCGSG